jgi:hypothetical protein
MQTAISQFRHNIDSVKELDSIHTLIIEKYPLLKNMADEILRAEIVMLVSAMDCYIHDIVRTSMVEIFKGLRPSNKFFDNYCISSKALLLILNSTNADYRNGLFDNEIKEINSKDSFQNPSSIEYALKFLEIKGIWSSLENYIGMKPEDIKQTMSLIIYRRNKIAHEADYNEVNLSKNPIDKKDVKSIYEFITKFCEGVNAIVCKNINPQIV